MDGLNQRRAMGYTILLPNGRVVVVTPDGIRAGDDHLETCPRAQGRLQALQAAYDCGWSAPAGASARALYGPDAGLVEAFARGNSDAHGFGFTRTVLRRRPVTSVTADEGPRFGAPLDVPELA